MILINRKNNLIALVFFFFCSSCVKNEYKKRERLENKVIGQTWRQLEKEKNLIPVREGGSVVEGNEFLGLYFQYFHPLTIDEARQLVIYAAQEFLNILNSNEKLNELIEKPYPMSWIAIRIFIYNQDHSNVDPPGITVAELKRNEITYFYKRKKTEIEQRAFVIIQEETYEEALEKLKENDTNKSKK